MRGFSQVVVAGNVTRDPELRTTPNGASACSFTIAVNRQYKAASGEMTEQTSFIDCVAWGRQGETISQYVKKGNPLLVSGHLEQRSWDDKTTGQKRYRTEVVVSDFSFISGGAQNGGGFSGGNGGGFSRPVATAPAAVAEDFAPEDVPEDEVINLDEIPF